MKLRYPITKTLFIVIFTAAFCFSLQAQQGWKVIVPYPTNNALSAVSFINETSGWIAGSGDCILKTTDGGGSWSKQTTLTGQDWWGVYFADAQHGWVANSFGGVSATADGGSTWHTQASSSSLYLYAMQFTDALHGFVLFEQDSLLYTTNGGSNWNRIKIDNTQYHYGMYFVTPNEGWICGAGGQVLHTTNGGLNWGTQTTGTTIDLYTIFFTDNQNGWAAGYTNSDLGIVLHTTDGGGTWSALVQNFSDKLIRIMFTDVNHGVGIGSSGKIYNTTDGGQTWNAVYSSPHEALWDIQVLSSGTGYSCGSSGAILKTSNSGALWTPVYKTATHGYTIRDLSFPDQKHGWVLDDASYLMHTADSGSVWTDQTPFPASFTSRAIHYSDATRGWVVGQDASGTYGQILRTINGGGVYNFQLNLGAWPFISVSFSDSLHGIAGTNNRMIYYTSNGGTVWDSASVPLATAYMQARNVQMVDNTTGYAILSAVNNTALAKTTNGGQSWTVIKTDNTQFTAAYTALSFTDAQHGYLAAFTFNNTPNKFSLLKTTDGGTSWTPVTFPSLPGNIGTTQINALHFSDMQHGLAAGGGSESFILYTADGGATWTLEEVGTTVSWYTMKFSDALTGYAAGWDGDIIKTINGGVGINEIMDNRKNDLVIYPNPASESVVIHYPQTGAEKSQIHVFDLMGKQLYSGILENSDGNISVSGYPNGIYFIQVSSENCTMIKKLIVSR
jgi:photosystem II stability/assembly factor-like uncharacterized protein